MYFENYTIQNFMDAKYKGKRDIMDDAMFKCVETEYIDKAGLYATEEFDKVSYIHFLSNRVNSVKLSIKLQRDFIDNFEVPYTPELKFFEKFGHNLYWGKDKDKFLEQLKRIELKENKYISKLESELKALTDMRAKKNSGEKTLEQSRESFVRTLNSLGKIGYKIERNVTTMEDLSYMIKDETKK